MIEANIYNQKGQKSGKIKLPERVFGLPPNADLLHQVVRTMELNRRTPVAHTKDRSEVSGTGKKPWRQKGTGRARHGSRRSPIWRTGGVSHGPRNEKDYSGKINKKMRAKALYVALSGKMKDGEIMFLDMLSFEKPAAKEAKSMLMALSKAEGFEGLSAKKDNRLLLSLFDKNKTVGLSFNNFGNVKVGETRNLNPASILKYKYLIIENPEKSVEFLSSRLPSGKAERNMKTSPEKKTLTKKTGKPKGKKIKKSERSVKNSQKPASVKIKAKK
ncbi:50S ribosomal protein L4 [Candidatus Campbellbacteria bacterium CG11_big_fil_rev_8_21_14_0_20_44_21]|uniref:Large ribosomal subunit protein uL4 n=1 Tax=Candidatus Campbellbacteria bacterium CG22_combo_CG10-13_8_21_14_all_43_18 TaxID=1974530 RepID=A0A2H0DXC1_9BACT|nr:MAG: 50S ribosomal protein L4 [Candidatus Campbellbacteria bacterium CG22_combo_CG10-13_8_21_14_all_43_18]PIR24332.1 MAG: 50S ribosomal protein L4 [Candidatus Campbellbacteria bacterium CG11_big_fil_rev_8_21_14_0_20_44_21]